MKRKLLFAALCFIMGLTQVKAFTVDDLTSEGWTKVTSLSSVGDYYYVFVDANTSDYAMGRLSFGNDRPVYQSLVDPFGFAGVVWYLSEDGGNYTIKSLLDDNFFISGTEGWNDQIANQQWGNEGLFTFTASLPEGKFSIQSVKTSSYVGPWNNDNKVSLTDGYENIAANKASNQAPGFYLYSIPRDTYNAQRITASWLTSHGWSQVTANSALGNADNYYLIVEKVSFGYALARTSSGRPVSKSLSNPFATPNELWTLEASGSGYKFKNNIDGTYFSSAAGDWNTSMGNHNADIIATVADGVYTLSAGGTSNIGHWRDDQFFPYENENVAANKNETNRNSYYIYTISKTDYATQRAAYIASLASSATKDSPVELTSFIFNNNDFATLAKLGWTVSGTFGNQQTSNGTFETWNSTNVSITQELAGMPGGKYALTVQMVSGDAGRVPYLYASADDEYTANVTQQASDASYGGMKNEIAANPSYGLLTVNPISSEGSLTVGMKAPTGWVVFDNFKLYYQGPTLSSTAIALPADGEMAANTWYFIDIAAAADNYSATATDLGTIICVTDGNILVEDATSGDITLTATDNTLAVGRYYVKSSSANNLEIGVASYTYSVSAATADKAYIQPGQTVTVSYTVNTNDPGATLTQNYSGVTFNGESISVTPTASGFTFVVPEVTAATSPTLYIPANAIGYDGSTYNEEQSITLTTPAIYDGIYFLKAAATFDGSSEGTSAAVGKYLARGMNYGTHATLDKYGLPLQITTDANNATSIQAFDTKRYFFHANDYDCYADQTPLAASGYFTVTKSNGKLLIHNNSMAAGTYLKYNTSAAGNANIGVYDDGDGTNSGPIIMWTTESPAEHAVVMQTLKDTQAAAAAAAAYASGNYASLNGISTVAALEAELTANYIEGVFVAPSTIESISEKYQGGQPSASNVTETVYSNTINITQPGFYKFSMQAFYRAGSNEVTQAMHTAGIDFPPVVLFFGNSETQIKSIYDEGGLDQGIAPGYFETETVGGAPVQYNDKWYTNGQHNSVIIFQKDYYHNDVWFYASEPGEYSYGVKYMGFASANMQWFIYSPESVTITSYAAAANTADYTALTNAINAYDAAAWGFESGEYAPYNNVSAIENITAAKAINSEVQNSKLLVNSLTTAIALSAPNAEEVNAFYGGDFTQYATISGEDMPYGWNLYNGANNHSRIMGGTEGSSNAGLSATTSGKALLLKFNATYGESEGYTMPLKASTLYKVTFKHGRWGEANPRVTDVVMTDPDGASITLAPGFQAETNDCQSNSENWYTYTGYFVSTKAGDYKFNLTKQGGNSQMQIAIADIDLRTASEIEFADGSVPTYAPGTYPSVKITRNLTAKRWATAVYPFAVSGVDNIAVLDSYDAETGALGFTSATASTANQPFLMRSTAGATEISLSNVEVAAAAAEPVVTKNEASLKGTYTSTAISNAEKNYVLSNNAIYSVGTAGATINPYRAYIQIDQSSEVKALTFFVDDTETAIEGINADVNNDAEIFNLAGQRVNKAQRGIYIINGKKVLVK